MVQVDIGATRDTNIDSANAHTNFSAATEIVVGIGPGGKSGFVIRTLMHFDLAAAGIGAGDTIDSAVLNLYVAAIVEDVTGPEGAATLYRLTRSNWEADGDVGGDGSYADYVHYIHDTDSWTTVGGDYSDPGAGDEASVAFTLRNTGDGAGWLQITLTNMTKDAQANRSQQLHILLKRDNETDEGRNGIVSNNHGTAGFRPFLDVDYTPGVAPTRRRFGLAV